MLILISGANGSGKSRFAEGLVCRMSEKRRYIATMLCKNEENHIRIEKHRVQRAGKGFITCEEPYSVGAIAVEKNDAVLLEDVSNLLANVIFEKGGGADEVYRDILALEKRCGVLAAVTIGGLNAEDYEGETADYISALDKLNRLLADSADAVVDMVNGKPVYRKGEADALY